nr:Imm70 family immunity protein [Olegusella massiliensis]
MDIGTTDGKRIVNVGSATDFRTLYATAAKIMGRKSKDVARGLDFIKTGQCGPTDSIETARQINLIKDELARHRPSDAVTETGNRPQWINEISPVITSCANLFTTADGGDLLHELVSLLCYADVVGIPVDVM